MLMMRVLAYLLTPSLAMSNVPTTVALTQLAGTRIPGGCDVPVSQRTAETGCYLVATTPLGTLPSAPVYWHLYRYPTRAAADG